MATLTAAQVAALVVKVGFPDIQVSGTPLRVIMVAICRAESGYRVDALNPSSASGLFQILWSVHRQYDQRRLLSDPEYNTQAALDIYNSQGLRAWVVYTSGAYQKYLAEARQGVAQASSVTGSPVLPDAQTGASTGITYGPLGEQLVTAGVGAPQGAAQEISPLQPLRVIGAAMWAEVSRLVLGAPLFETGIETVPHLSFTLADPGGALLQTLPIFVRGARVQYVDLNLRIDEVRFEPGSHGTGQIVISAIDDIAYALMNLTGSATAEGISATWWLAAELNRLGIDPNRYLLGEAVPTQSQISRDTGDQQGAVGAGQRPSAWTTMTRLGRELGKRFFISGTRIVFGSSAFAMRWCAAGSLRLTYSGPLAEGEKWITLPTTTLTSVGNRSDVLQVVGRVPLNRAGFFRPGVSVIVRNTPSSIGDAWVEMVCSHVAYNLGTDTDGAEITLVQPVDPPPEPPSSPNPNAGNPSAGTSVSGGGADGQVDKFVSIALQQVGKAYVFGAEVAASDPNPRAFDCSELVEYAAARAGINPTVPDGSANQLAHCRSHGTMVSIPVGVATKGALLFMPGHVAISLGGGSTVEAMNPSQGVRKGNANGRGWTAAAKIPGAQGYR